MQTNKVVRVFIPYKLLRKTATCCNNPDHFFVVFICTPQLYTVKNYNIATVKVAQDIWTPIIIP